MSFQSLGFWAFLALALAVCLTAGRRSPRTGAALLTAASALFYLLGPGGWTVVLGGLVCLLLGIGVTAWAVRRMGRNGGDRRRTLALACAYHIAVLAGFKYLGFFTGGAVDVGWAPLGLSFFTFQQLWLLKEVCTGEYVPAAGDSLLLYGLFFPTVTSGPILRPEGFFPQLRGESFLRPDWSDAAAGVYAICCGTIKKVLLADAFGTVVNNGWARLGDLSAPSAWLVILGYTLQLYFDFSGYCDIAAGVARLFGLRLPVNFDSPYRGRLRHGVLEALAHHPDHLPAGVPVLPPGGQPPGHGTDVSQHPHHLSGQRPVARGRVDVPGLGRPPRPGPDRRAGLGQGPGPSAPPAALGADVPVRQPRLGVLPGTGLRRRSGAALPGRHRRPCQAGALAAGGPVHRGDQRGADAPARPHPLEEHPADSGAVRRRHGRRPLAPERDPSDGGRSAPPSAWGRP